MKEALMKLSKILLGHTIIGNYRYVIFYGHKKENLQNSKLRGKL